MRQKTTSKKKKPLILPLICWDVFINGLFVDEHFHKYHQNLLKFSIEELWRYYQWSTDPTPLLRKNYDALVLTDLEQKILWVDKGFEKMTGYSPEFAIGKKPGFLQGKDTSPHSLRKIKDNLTIKAKFTSTLLNYKKDGRPYFCEISITPLLDPLGSPTHFLAVEKEVGL